MLPRFGISSFRHCPIYKNPNRAIAAATFVHDIAAGRGSISSSQLDGRVSTRRSQNARGGTIRHDAAAVHVAAGHKRVGGLWLVGSVIRSSQQSSSSYGCRSRRRLVSSLRPLWTRPQEQPPWFLSPLPLLLAWPRPSPPLSLVPPPPLSCGGEGEGINPKVRLD